MKIKPEKEVLWNILYPQVNKLQKINSIWNAIQIKQKLNDQECETFGNNLQKTANWTPKLLYAIETVNSKTRMRGGRIIKFLSNDTPELTSISKVWSTFASTKTTKTINCSIKNFFQKKFRFISIKNKSKK